MELKISARVYPTVIMEQDVKCEILRQETIQIE